MTVEKEKILFDNSSLPINLASRCSERDLDLRSYHFHSEIELVRVSRGSIWCEVADERVKLTPGSILMINRNAIHRLRYAEEGTEFSYLQINIDPYLRQIFPNNSIHLYEFMNLDQTLPYACFAGDAEPEEIFERIRMFDQARPPYYDISVKAYIYLLVAFLCRRDVFYDFQATQNSKAVAKLLPAIAYVEENFKERITLDELCNAVYMDKYNFCKLFKRVTGSTFVEYLNFRRLSHAEHLLSETDDTVSKIAMDCGFNSIQYFNRAFKARKKCTPNSYRRMQFRVFKEEKG